MADPDFIEGRISTHFLEKSLFRKDRAGASS